MYVLLNTMLVDIIWVVHYFGPMQNCWAESKLVSPLALYLHCWIVATIDSHPDHEPTPLDCEVCYLMFLVLSHFDFTSLFSLSTHSVQWLLSLFSLLFLWSFTVAMCDSSVVVLVKATASVAGVFVRSRVCVGDLVWDCVRWF